jgi:hypothetical protein
MEEDAVPLLIVAMAKGDKVWLVVLGKRDGNVLSGFQYSLELLGISNLFVFPPQMICHSIPYP